MNKISEFYKKNKIKVFLVCAILIQTIVFVFAGLNKSYIHMDEAYSLGLANYDQVEIQKNDDFYNTWHDGKYYEDYLSVQKDEKYNFKPVYENQKNDVHPPLYYLLLRLAMGFSIDHFSKWSGIILNIIIYSFITYFMYLILKIILEKENNYEIKSIIFAFISSITLASITNVVYIRMYCLATLNVVITTYLHILLYKKFEKKTLIYIGLMALAGSLTHYYYLFYLAMLYIVMMCKFISSKDKEYAIKYTITFIIAAAVSLAIFPFSIRHMFFGYRGDGAISNLTSLDKIPSTIKNILHYLWIIHFNAFNSTFIIIVLSLLGLGIYNKIHKKDKIELEKYLKLLYLPSLFYFVLVAITSPYVELRYILPICPIIFVLFIYLLYKQICRIFKNENSFKIVCILLVIILMIPLLFRMEPEEIFSDKKEIVNSFKNELNVPTVFWFYSRNNRFLDDILLFSILDESYVAKDVECNKENVKNIFKRKNISNGVIVFINEGQDNDNILNTIKETLELDKIEHLKKMNACDIYYISN